MSNRMVALMLDGQRYALHLAQVVRVIRAVATTPLPKAPEIVMGVINVQGQVIPLINTRKRARLPERGVLLSDHVVVAHTARRIVALLVDQVDEVIEIPDDRMVHAETIIPEMDYIDGVAKLDDGMILIHNLDRFLSIEEEQTLDGALADPTIPKQ